MYCIFKKILNKFRLKNNLFLFVYFDAKILRYVILFVILIVHYSSQLLIYLLYYLEKIKYFYKKLNLLIAILEKFIIEKDPKKIIL